MPLLNASFKNVRIFNGDYWLNYSYGGAVLSVLNYAPNPSALNSQGNYITVVGTPRRSDFRQVNAFTILVCSSSGYLLNSAHIEDNIVSLAYDLVCDASDNIYILAQSSTLCYLIKFDSALTRIWTKLISDSGYNYRTLDITPTGELVAVGTSSALTNVIVSKIDLSGTFIWTKTFGDAALSEAASVTNCDSLGNIYVSGSFSAGGNFFLSKINATGTTITTKSFTTTAYGSSPLAIEIGSAGDIFLVLQRTEGTQPNIIFYLHALKINAALTAITWQKRFNSGTTNIIFGTAILDSADNLYMSTDGPDSANLMKVTSAGATAWQKKLSIARVAARLCCTTMLITASDDLVLPFFSFSSVMFGYETFAGILKYPSSGTLVGTIHPITIATVTPFTSTVPVCTIGTYSWALTNQTYTTSDQVLSRAINVPEYLNTDVHWDAVNFQGPTAYYIDLYGAKLLVAGAYAPGSNARALVTEFDAELNVVKRIGNSAAQSGFDYTYFRRIGADSSGNLYCFGSMNTSLSTDSLLLVKFSSTGSVVWQRSIATSEVNIASDKCNLHVLPDGTSAVSQSLTSTIGVHVARFTPTGGSIGKTYGSTATSVEGNGIVQDASGNIYISGIVSIASARKAFYVCKLTSAGVIVWQKTYSHPVGFCVFGGVQYVGSSLYLVGGISADNTAGESSPCIMCLSETDGSVIWQTAGEKRAGENIRITSVYADSSGNLVAVSYYFIAKFDVAGLNISTFRAQFPTIPVVLNDILYYAVSVSSNTDNSIDVYKLPLSTDAFAPISINYSSPGLVVGTPTLTVIANTASAAATGSWANISYTPIRFQTSKGLDIQKTLLT